MSDTYTQTIELLKANDPKQKLPKLKESYYLVTEDDFKTDKFGGVVRFGRSVVTWVIIHKQAFSMRRGRYLLIDSIAVDPQYSPRDLAPEVAKFLKELSIHQNNTGEETVKLEYAIMFDCTKRQQEIIKYFGFTKSGDVWLKKLL